MTPEQRELRRWLRQKREDFSLLPGMVYRGPADFVICHGEWHSPIGSMPLIPQHCYHNAILAVESTPGWIYVEGYAVSPDRKLLKALGMTYVGPDIVHHAWALDDAGRAIELTWPVPGRAYRGVCFHHGRADDATWNGDATVLDDFNRDHPLLRKTWAGEDWAREWAPTIGMDMIHEALGSR